MNTTESASSSYSRVSESVMDVKRQLVLAIAWQHNAFCFKASLCSTLR